MKPDILPVVTPAEGVLMLAFAKLVAHLEKMQVISAGEFAEILAAQADAVPEQCRALVESMADGMRTPKSQMRVVLREDEIS